MFLHWQARRFSPEPLYHCWKSPTLGKLKANWQSGSWDGFVSLTLCRGCTLPWEASGAPPPHPAPPPAPSDLPPQLGEPLPRHCSAEPAALASCCCLSSLSLFTNSTMLFWLSYQMLRKTVLQPEPCGTALCVEQKKSLWLHPPCMVSSRKVAPE